MSGDAQNEAYQEEQYAKSNSLKAKEFAEYRATKNSFWPKFQEAANPWTLGVVGAGAVGLAAERAVRYFVLQP